MAQLHRHCIPTDPNQDIDSGIPGTAI
jgi:hypothetical protein